MSVLFKPILKIEVWHDYFLGPDEHKELPDDYDISEAIALIPTAECQQTLKRLRWLIRPQPYGAVLLARVISESDAADSFEPFVSIDTETRLTFWMVVRDRNFANYTNLPLTAARDRLYYYSNLSKNSVPSTVTDSSQPSDTSLFLSAPLEPYAKNRAYAIGDMVAYQQNTDRVTLEAATALSDTGDSPSIIPPFKNGNGTSAGNSSSSNVVGNWIVKAGSQYVSAQDQYHRQSLFRTEVLDRAGPGDRLVLTDVNKIETVVFIVPQEHPPETPLSAQLNLADYPPGYYQLSYVQGSDRTQLDDFVLFDPMAGRDAFALVELSLNPAIVSQDFQVLSTSADTQQLSPKTYRIRFKNRATRWRYHHQRPTATPPSPSPPEYFETIDAKTFVTKYPFEHYRHPDKRITLAGKHALPVPSPTSSLSVQRSDQDPQTITALFSDIYL